MLHHFHHSAFINPNLKAAIYHFRPDIFIGNKVVKEQKKKEGLHASLHVGNDKQRKIFAFNLISSE